MLDVELRHAEVSTHPPGFIHENFNHCIAST